VDTRFISLDAFEPVDLTNARFSGVYFLYKGDQLYYIGQSRNVGKRLAKRVGTFDSAKAIRVPEEDLKEVELYWIKALRPKWNIQGNPDTVYEPRRPRSPRPASDRHRDIVMRARPRY
jgi:hypothetical protein